MILYQIEVATLVIEAIDAQVSFIEIDQKGPLNAK